MAQGELRKAHLHLAKFEKLLEMGFIVAFTLPVGLKKRDCGPRTFGVFPRLIAQRIKLISLEDLGIVS